MKALSKSTGGKKTSFRLFDGDIEGDCAFVCIY